MRRTIGIDFDNTIVDYDDVFVRCGRALQLLPANFRGTKMGVRDAIRALPDGNARWTELQAVVYGREIAQAVPFAGFADFLKRAAAARAPVCVISHKSRFAAADLDGIDLREAALGWLRAQGFLGSAGPLHPETVYFESERAAKLARIGSTGCTDFIDDLVEILDDPAFPPDVRRYHFAGGAPAATGYPSWRAVGDAIFGDCGTA